MYSLVPYTKVAWLLRVDGTTPPSTAAVPARAGLPGADTLLLTVTEPVPVLPLDPPVAAAAEGTGGTLHSS